MKVSKLACSECGVNPCNPECRHIPDTDIGKIYPNAFCRGRRKQKRGGGYCTQPAGKNTSHAGDGRCWLHGGNKSIVHGQRTGTSGRYANIAHERLRDKLAKFEADPTPLNVIAELNLTRALLEDFIERHEEFSAALLAWFESYKATGRQVPPDQIQALHWVIDEYEALQRPMCENGDGEILDRKLASVRQTVERLGTPIDEGRPRRMVDIAAARHMVDTIKGLVDSIQKHDQETHISRRAFFAFNAEIGRVAGFVIDKHLAKEHPELAEAIKTEMGEKWLNVRLPV